jgi:CheY-like chemotaxis protein
MVKIMLVEDDKSLREIYGVRLLAEGYDIVSAGDGEEAVAMAIKERPQLIVSDVMMPKISGFDMLDILQSTTETKDIKVIMMTALSSDEQRARGESLGADRYLVKSQVGIEDVVKVVHEVLGDLQTMPTTTPAPPTAPATMAPQRQPTFIPQAAQRSSQPNQPTAPPVNPTTSTFLSPASATPSTFSAQLPPGHNKVIQPINDPRVSPIDINDLLNKELSKESNNTTIPSAAEEKESIDAQLQQFANTPPPPAPTVTDNIASPPYATPVFTPPPVPLAPPTPQYLPDQCHQSRRQ